MAQSSPLVEAGHRGAADRASIQPDPSPLEHNSRHVSMDVVYYLLVGAAILVGMASRLHALGDRSLWGDEIAQATWARQSLVWIYKLLRPSFEAALGTYVLHFTRVLGESEFILRLPGALFGVLSLALVYRLGQRLFGSLTGVLAAFLLSASPSHLAHSQEVHPYTLVVLLTLLSLDRFVVTLRRRSWRAGIAWLAATVLSLYTHPFTVFVFAAEMATVGILAIYECRRRSTALPWAHFLIGGALVLLLWLPEIVPAVPDLIRRSTAQGGVISGGDISWIQRALSDLWGMLRQLGEDFAGTISALAVLLVLSAGGVVLGWHRGKRRPLLLCLLVLILPLTTAPFRTSSVLFYPRYFIFMLPVFLTLAAWGASVLLQHSGRLIERFCGDRWSTVYRIAMPIVLSCLILIGYAAPVLAYYRKGNHDWRGLASYLSKNVDAGDVVVQIWMGQPYSLAWYFHPPASVRVLQAHELSQKALTLPPKKRIWWVFIQQGQLRRLRERMGVAFDVVPFYGLSVLHYSQGQHSPEETLDATVSLLELESEIHADSSQRYHELITRLLQQGGKGQAQFYLTRGDGYRAEKKWKEAEAAYRRAIDCWPNWGMAHTRLGNAYRDQGDAEKALAAYRRAIQVDPTYLGAYVQCGLLHESLGQTAQALSLYQQALDLDANSAWAHSALGSLYVRLGNAPEAVAHLRKSVSLDPQNVAWLLALADGYRALDMGLEAAEAYQQVLALDPDNRRATEALRDLGR